MKIKIIFSFLSAAFFSLGVLFVSMDGRSGAVLGDTASVSPTVAQDIVTSLPAASVGTLPSSGTVAVMPVTPPSLQAVVSGPMSVELNWTRPGNASGTVTYKITRNGDVIKVYTNVLSHKDDGLSSGAEYKYSVWAKDELGRTVESPKVTVVLPVSSLKTDAAVTATIPMAASPVSEPELKVSYPIIDRPTDSDAPETNDPISADIGSATKFTVGIQPKVDSGDASITLPQQEVRESGAPKETLSDRDTDNDGLPDAEEIRVGSDPFSADTDDDGFSDAEEIRNGFNPLRSASDGRGDKVVFESPKEKRMSKAAFEDKRLRVESVERVARDDGRIATKISGKGTPNSFLTVYVYSDPIVVTVKTDADGNWSYELDRDLEDGNHEVYVAVTDATGRISAQSSPIPFVKTAEAISVVPVSDMESEMRGNQSPIERAGGQFVFFGIAIVIMFLLGAFYFIGHRAFSD